MKLKPLRPGKAAPKNKHAWSQAEINFLKRNFYESTNRQLAKKLKLTLTLVRTKCYELGLKRMELEYWTDEQVVFLQEKYKAIGDVELAEIFQSRWPKNKGWTLKHIEKKRMYLKLKRTRDEVKAIHQRNVSTGRFSMCPVKAWMKRGVSEEGTIKYWNKSGEQGDFPVIKVDGKYRHWGRWKWEQTYGEVPAGMNVVFKDRNNRNLALENLAIVTNAELSKWNSTVSSQGLSDNYIRGILTHGEPELRKHVTPDLIKMKRLQLELNRTINEQSRKNNQ